MKFKKIEKGVCIQYINSSKYPHLCSKKIKAKSLKDLHGSITIKVHNDINTHVLPSYDKWESYLL